MEAKVTDGRILCYEDGDVIFEEDSIGNEIYIIESGKVEIKRRINGKSMTICLLGKGDLFGETAIFTNAPRSATAVSLGRTMLMSLTMEEIVYRMQNNVQFTINLMQTLVNRLHNNNSALINLISKVQEFSEGLMDGIFPEKRPLKLGEILIETGHLTRSQLERVIQKQKEIHILERRHKLLGEIMLESGMITEEQLRNALAEQKIRLRNRSE